MLISLWPASTLSDPTSGTAKGINLIFQDICGSLSEAHPCYHVMSYIVFKNNFVLSSEDARLACS